MENKKYNKITAQDLYCSGGDKFVVQCGSYSDLQEFTDYAEAVKFLNEHLKVLHYEDAIVRLLKRISIKVNGMEIGVLDVPILVYTLYLQAVEHPKKEADKVWNAYVSAYNEKGYSGDTSNLRTKLYGLMGDE